MAIARKLLVVVWHVLSKQVADQKANEDQVARKLISWAYNLRKQGRRGLGARPFVRKRLQALSIGMELTEVVWAGKTFNLPPPAKPVEVVAI